MTEGTWTPDDLAAACAEAAAAVLPASSPLIAGPAQPGSPHVTAAFAGAAIAELDGVAGRIAVLVGQELVEAIANSPLSGLDLAAATQPALDAVAGILGARAQAAGSVELELVVNDLGGDFTTVPLIGASIAGAILVPNAVLEAANPTVDGNGQFVVGSPAVAAVVTEAAVPADGSFAAAQHEVATEVPVAAPVAAAPAPPAPTAPAPAAAVSTPLPPHSGGNQVIVGNPPPAPPVAAPGAPIIGRGIEMLHGVDMEVTVELGRTRMTVKDLLALSPGAVLELDRAAGSPADLLVNGRLIARGEVVVVDEDFGLRVTEILDDTAVV